MPLNYLLNNVRFKEILYVSRMQIEILTFTFKTLSLMPMSKEKVRHIIRLIINTLITVLYFIPTYIADAIGPREEAPKVRGRGDPLIVSHAARGCYANVSCLIPLSNYQEGSKSTSVQREIRNICAGAQVQQLSSLISWPTEYTQLIS